MSRDTVAGTGCRRCCPTGSSPATSTTPGGWPRPVRSPASCRPPWTAALEILGTLPRTTRLSRLSGGPPAAAAARRRVPGRSRISIRRPWTTTAPASREMPAVAYQATEYDGGGDDEPEHERAEGGAGAHPALGDRRGAGGHARVHPGDREGGQPGPRPAGAVADDRARRDQDLDARAEQGVGEAAEHHLRRDDDQPLGPHPVGQPAERDPGRGPGAAGHRREDAGGARGRCRCRRRWRRRTSRARCRSRAEHQPGRQHEERGAAEGAGGLRGRRRAGRRQPAAAGHGQHHEQGQPGADGEGRPPAERDRDDRYRDAGDHRGQRDRRLLGAVGQAVAGGGHRAGDEVVARRLPDAVAPAGDHERRDQAGRVLRRQRDDQHRGGADHRGEPHDRRRAEAAHDHARGERREPRGEEEAGHQGAEQGDAEAEVLADLHPEHADHVHREHADGGDRDGGAARRAGRGPAPGHALRPAGGRRRGAAGRGRAGRPGPAPA